jgi:ribosome-binding protein aMBF1 (putative translation factor)
MELTPEQQSQVDQAKAAGDRRVTLRFTPRQRRDWQAAVQQEWSVKEDTLTQFRKIKAAAEQRGFCGDVRKAMALDGRSSEDLACEIGVEPQLLSDFRAGEAELPATVLDRLLEALGLRLMQEIGFNR